MKKIAIIVVLLLFVQWWFTDPSITVPTNNITFSYIVKYTDVSNKNDRLPMLVALHGNADTTENFYESALNKFSAPVRIILIEGPISKGMGSAWPWSPEEFAQYGKAINEAIELLSAKYPTIQKPILVGFSGGGMMAYYQAVKYGRSYSSIFSISGKLSKEMLGDNSSAPGAKVYAFHGVSDQVISIGAGRSAVEVLKAKGVNVKFTEFDGGHLGIFKAMKTEITDFIEKKIFSLD